MSPLELNVSEPDLLIDAGVVVMVILPGPPPEAPSPGRVDTKTGVAEATAVIAAHVTVLPPSERNSNTPESSAPVMRLLSHVPALKTQTVMLGGSSSNRPARPSGAVVSTRAPNASEPLPDTSTLPP